MNRVTPEQLFQKSCVPCRGGVPAVTAEQARQYCAAVPAWTLSSDTTRIAREFTFKGFPEAMVFVNRVAELAEAEQHHPDITIHWNKVGLVLWTHAIGGLHENDFVMAAKIDRV